MKEKITTIAGWTSEETHGMVLQPESLALTILKAADGYKIGIVLSQDPDKVSWPDPGNITVLIEVDCMQALLDTAPDTLKKAMELVKVKEAQC